MAEYKKTLSSHVHPSSLLPLTYRYSFFSMFPPSLIILIPPPPCLQPPPPSSSIHHPTFLLLFLLRPSPLPQPTSTFYPTSPTSLPLPPRSPFPFLLSFLPVISPSPPLPPFSCSVSGSDAKRYPVVARSADRLASPLFLSRSF